MTIVRWGCYPCPIRWGFQHHVTLDNGPPCRLSLACQNYFTYFFTHWDHDVVDLSVHVAQISYVSDRFHTGRGTLYMCWPSWLAGSEGLPLYPQCYVFGVVKPRTFVSVFGATDAADHVAIIVTEPLQLICVLLPNKYSRTDANSVYLVGHLGQRVPGGEDEQDFLDLSWSFPR